MERVIINVSGTKFELSATTFQKLTKIKDSKFLSQADRTQKQEYFLERSPLVFSGVLHFLTCCELHLPPNLCPHSFIKELEFWGLGLNDVTSCCKNVILLALEESETLAKFERDAERSDETKWKKSSSMSTLRYKAWLTVNEPCYSTISKVYAAIAGTAVILSVFVLTAQTHYSFQRRLEADEWKDYLGELLEEDMKEFYDYQQYDLKNKSLRFLNETVKPENATVRMDFLTILEYFTTIFFTVDILFRFLLCPRKLGFLTDFFNVTDLIALISVLTHLVIERVYSKERYRSSMIDIVGLLQILRILRFLRIVKRVRGFRVLVYSMRAGIKEFMTVAMFVFLAVITFGSLIYFLDDRSEFKHIPDGMYWALITVTTVGYGDMVPVTFVGKIVACFCAMLGVLLTAATVPVFVNNFLMYYSHASVISLKENMAKTKKSKIKMKIKVQPSDVM